MSFTLSIKLFREFLQESDPAFLLGSHCGERGCSGFDLTVHVGYFSSVPSFTRKFAHCLFGWKFY